MKLVFPDEQALLLGDTGWFPGALGYRFIFEASTQNVERYVLLDTMPQAGDGDGRSRPVKRWASTSHGVSKSCW